MTEYSLQRIELRLVREHDFSGKIKRVSCAEEAYAFVKDLESEAVEKLAVLYMNQRHDVLAAVVLFSGGMSESVVDPKAIFKVALDLGANTFIIAHNHPSGDPQPSLEDIALTKRLQEGGKYLDIRLLDHLVIGLGSYFSMLENGYISS